MSLLPRSTTTVAGALALLAALAAGCLEPHTVTCDWGLVCPAGSICHPGMRRCVASVQRTVCSGLRDGDECSFPGSDKDRVYRCSMGFCEQPWCGDTIVDPGEDDPAAYCEDSNSEDHDGCSRSCREEGYYWTRLTTKGAAPPRRSEAGLVYDSDRNRVVLFGGLDVQGKRLADTWQLDLADEEGSVLDAISWVRLQSPGPPPRSEHAMAYDPAHRRVVLFGGLTPDKANNAFYDDLWQLDGDRWTELNDTDTPHARHSHVLAYDGATQKVVLVGGYLNGGWGSNIQTLDGAAWYKHPIVKPCPAQASEHVTVYNPETARFLITGGDPVFHNTFDPEGFLETWTFESGSGTWAKQGGTPDTPYWSLWNRQGSLPGNKFWLSAAAAYDLRASRVVLFGGGKRKIKTQPTTACQDTLVFQSGRWKEAPVYGDRPSPRFEHSMVSLSDGLGVLVFGGTDGKQGPLNDLWMGRYGGACNNDTLERGEICDEGKFVEGLQHQDCTKLGMGYASGAFSCTRRCTINLQLCKRKAP